MNLYLMAFQLMLFAQRQIGGRPGGGVFGQPPGGNNPFGPGPAGGGNVQAEPPIGLLLAIYGVMFVVFVIPTLVGMWKVFEKAGQPGWAALIPIYNMYVMGEISGKGGGYGIMVGIGMCLPCIGLVALIFYILLLIDLCKAYDQGAGMAIGLWLLGPVFWPILGFGSAEYVGIGGRRSGRSRRRRDYDDDDDDDDRPRRRGRDDDDDDDRPRRSRRDDDDDNPPRRPRRGDDEGDDRVRKRRPDDY